MRRIIITATGTEVGKTWVTAALCKQLLERGNNVRALKPLATGAPLRPDDSTVVDGDTDAHVLLNALSLRPTNAALNRVNPLTLPEPLSPDMAAARVLRTITADELVSLCGAGPEEVLLIEGIGGAMVPLNERETTLDWFARLDAPAIVVAGAYLGTLSHTLSTVVALKSRGIDVASVIVCEREPGPVVLEETIRSLEHHLDMPVLGVPHLSSYRDFPLLLGALPQDWIDWGEGADADDASA